MRSTRFRSETTCPSAEITALYRWHLWSETAAFIPAYRYNHNNQSARDAAEDKLLSSVGKSRHATVEKCESLDPVVVEITCENRQQTHGSAARSPKPEHVHTIDNSTMTNAIACCHQNHSQPPQRSPTMRWLAIRKPEEQVEFELGSASTARQTRLHVPL